MQAVRPPWECWVVLSLSAFVWWLIQLPGDPYLSDPMITAGVTLVAAVLLVLGSAIGWLLFALFATACAVLTVVWSLFGPPSDVSTLGLLALGGAACGQLALLFSPRIKQFAVEQDWRDE